MKILLPVLLLCACVGPEAHEGYGVTDVAIGRAIPCASGAPAYIDADGVAWHVKQTGPSQKLVRCSHE